jgi:hypothetical protein
MRCFLLLSIIACAIYPRPTYLGAIPNTDYVNTGNKTNCQICHEAATPNAANPYLNPFGRDFKKYGNDWNASLASLDSDGDFYTNSAELKCSNVNWISGTCGDYLKSTNPGDPEIFPGSTETEKPKTTLNRPYIRVEPNPFNPSTSICFSLNGTNSPVKVSIFNSNGTLVRTLHTEFKGSGVAFWDGKDSKGNYASAGVFCAVIANKGTFLSTRLILSR